MEGLIEDPTNPFTGNPINMDEKTAHDQIITLSSEWDVNINNGNTFLPSQWASVSENIWDKEKWSFLEEEVVLSQHSLS